MYAVVLTGGKQYQVSEGDVISVELLKDAQKGASIELDKVRFKGYGFQIEMKFTAWRIGFKIKEVPVIFVNRQEGVSKMSGGIFGEAFFGVMRLRWDGWTRKYPQIKN